MMAKEIQSYFLDTVPTHNTLLIILIWMFSSIDLALTYYIIGNGKGHEGNIIPSLVATQDIGWLKLACLITIIMFGRKKAWVLYTIIGVMALVVAWNMFLVIIL